MKTTQFLPQTKLLRKIDLPFDILQIASRKSRFAGHLTKRVRSQKEDMRDPDFSGTGMASMPPYWMDIRHGSSLVH